MKDRLPKISIKTDQPPEQFLRRMEQAAKELGEYLVSLEATNSGKRLTGRPLQMTQHRGLEGRLISAPGTADRVIVEIHASRWNPDPPTHETYATASRVLLQPLLPRSRTRIQLS